MARSTRWICCGKLVAQKRNPIGSRPFAFSSLVMPAEAPKPEYCQSG